MSDKPRTRIETEYCIVECDASQEVKDAVYQRVIEFCIEHQAFNGETIHQCDGPIIDAPCVLSDIVDDILKFDVRDKNEVADGNI